MSTYADTKRYRERKRRSRDPIRCYCDGVIAHFRATKDPAGSRLAARASDYLLRLDAPAEGPRKSMYALMGGESTGTGHRAPKGDPIDLEGLALAQAALDDGTATWSLIRAGLDHVGRLLRPRNVERDMDADFVALMRLVGGTPAPDHLVTRLGEVDDVPA